MKTIYAGREYARVVDALSVAAHDGNPRGCFLCQRCGTQFPHGGAIVCPRCGWEMPADFAADLFYGYGDTWRGYKAWGEEQRAKRKDIEEAEEAAKPEVPKPRLDDVIGNADAVMQIRTALDAFLARRKALGGDKRKLAFPHLLLSGPGGTGKTMLSEILAREIKAPIRLQMGQTLSTPAKVGDVLAQLRAGEVLFIDEIHGLKGPAQESLYRAMEDRKLVPFTKTGRPVETQPIDLPPFTLIGATTDEWGLLPSLCQRFKYRVRLQRLTAGELGDAMRQRAGRLGWSADPEALSLIGERALGTPRLAVGLLDGCMDTAVAQGGAAITPDIVRMTCAIWGIDSMGLDKVARQYLAFLAEANGGPVRLNVLAARLDGLSRTTVERKVEPDLVWLGLVTKAADGRRITPAGKAHLESHGK